MVTRNVGTTDQIIRYILAVVLFGVAIYLGLNNQVTPAIIAGVAGLISLVTGLFRFCGLYALLGIRTCPVESS